MYTFSLALCRAVFVAVVVLSMAGQRALCSQPQTRLGTGGEESPPSLATGGNATQSSLTTGVVTQSSLATGVETQSSLATGGFETQSSLATGGFETQSSLATGGFETQSSLATGGFETQSSLATGGFETQSSLATGDVERVPSCFQDEGLACTCLGATADCSHTGLSYIPAFPREITTLLFSFNNLTSISTGAFFRNVTGLVSLTMSDNGLGSIHPQAFRPLTKLQVLHLSDNRLSYSALSAVFAGGGVKRLYVRHMQLGPIPPGYFRTARPTTARLTLLDLSDNPIRHLNFSVLATLPLLTKLKCATCQVISTTSDRLPSLANLELQGNALLSFPNSCRNGSSLFPNLIRLNFQGNPLSELSSSSDFCWPRLEHLELSTSRISTVRQDMFNGQRFPRLTGLSLAYTQPILALERYAFRNPTLRTLSLMYCSIALSDDAVDPDCLAGVPGLRELQVSHNLGTGVPDQKLRRLFAPLAGVELLYMGSCGMETLRSRPFAKLTRLRVLKLYRNKLSEIPDGAFDTHRHLTDLVLSDNQLPTIGDSTFNATTRGRLRRLDLSGNPLLCDCHLLWFRGWFVSTPQLFNNSYGNYTCANRPRTLLQTFYLNEQVCFFTQETYKFLISSISLFVAALALVCTCYPYRWHVRLVLYEAFRGREGEAQRRRRLETGRFDYDVFVSYAHEDLAWVRDHLMPELEGHLGLRLCVHERDFIPGHNIVDNIVQSVGASKKVLVLFSRDFVASQWCQFELNLCLHHVLEHGDALLVTCLGDVTSLDVTSAMLAVLKVTTYIQWQDGNLAATASFWGRVRLGLREVLP